MVIKAIILDVYGTTLETKTPVVDPFAYLFTQARQQKIQFDTAVEKKRLLTQESDLGEYAKDLFRRAPHPVDSVEDIFLQAEYHLQQHRRAYQPRAEWGSFVHTAADCGMKLCLGSNLATPFTSAVRVRLPETDAAVFSCEIGQAKPQAEFFQTCCDMLDVAPKETIMIGNSRHSDIDGAKAAGLANAFWLPDGSYDPSDFARYNGINRLTDVFARLG